MRAWTCNLRLSLAYSDELIRRRRYNGRLGLLGNNELLRTKLRPRHIQLTPSRAGLYANLRRIHCSGDYPACDTQHNFNFAAPKILLKRRELLAFPLNMRQDQKIYVDISASPPMAQRRFFVPARTGIAQLSSVRLDQPQPKKNAIWAVCRTFFLQRPLHLAGQVSAGSVYCAVGAVDTAYHMGVTG